MSKSDRILLDSKQFDLTIKRLSHQLIENYNDFTDTIIIGLQPRGTFLANRIQQELKAINKDYNVQVGALDVTFYRDDYRRQGDPLVPSETEMDFVIEDKKVILVDDVLFTGRTIRSGLDAMLSFGRPSKVELMVLINRRYERHLPIQANYIGKNVHSVVSERVKVNWKETEGEDAVILYTQKMSKLSVEHLLGIKNLQAEDINLIFKTADHFKQVINRPIKKVPSLRDTTIANLFFENSTRTKLSFELAEKRLSADIVNFSSSNSSVTKGETLIDTVNNILSMKVDMVVMRHPNPGAADFLSKHVDAKIVNAGDGAHEHPTQALLDSFSIREEYGDLKGKNIVIVGDILHSRVALSNIFCLQKMGANVKVCGPLTLIPKYITSLGVEVITNLREALNWCDVAMMLRIQLERQDMKFFPSLREYSMMYGLDKKLLDSLDKEITIMHPGPINRGVEITSDVADSKQSIILNQVENGVAIRMAVLYLLAGKKE